MTRHVLITAGASGIGRAMAEAFAAEGAAVWIVDADAQALADCPDNWHRSHADVTDETAVRAIFAELVARWGRLDVLCANAGIAGPTAAIEGVAYADWQRCVSVNLDGAFLFCREAARIMKTPHAGPQVAQSAIGQEERPQVARSAIGQDARPQVAQRAIGQEESPPVLPPDGYLSTSPQAAQSAIGQEAGGCIIMTSSTAGLYGYPNRSPYCAAKWAVIGLMKTLAMELGPYGIRANALCPGSVEGERMQGVLAREAAVKGTTTDAIYQGYASGTSMKRWVTAQDIAAMATYLASAGARLVSGQVIAIDGHTENPDPKV